MTDKRMVAIRNRRRGKAFQSKLAKMVGGRNIGTLGGEDVEHKTFSIEAKAFASYRGETIMKQAENNCPKGKIPISIVHINGQRHERDIVHIRFNHFFELIKEDLPIKEPLKLKKREI